MAETSNRSPWYREPWPWLLMIAPATAVVAGFFTWWLAATSNNSMVVDDYYRVGRTINQQLARDHEASRLGLSATLSNAAGPATGIVVELRESAAPADWPEVLSLRLVHATESALDSQTRLAHQGNGRYAGAGALPASGRWIVHLEDGERHWRLVARAERFDEALTMRSDALTGGAQ